MLMAGAKKKHLKSCRPLYKMLPKENASQDF